MTGRRKAFNILKNVIDGGAYLHLALKEGLKDCDSGTAASVTALVYASIENLRYSDYLLSYYVRGRIHGSIRLVLRMGIAELLKMNTKSYAVIDESVKLAKAIGKAELSGFVNGVLRRIDRERDKLPALPTDGCEYLMIKYGIPDFLAREYLNEYGLEFTEAMLKTHINSMTVRAQYPCTAKELTEGMQYDEAFKQIGFRFGRLDSNAIILDKGVNVSISSLFSEGKLAVQSESAMLVCKLCRVKRGMNVLDACAAPGGKTAYLASLMENTGSITAWELHENRVRLINATLKRLNVKNASCECHDASVQKEELFSSMDVVLVDAPCSGFGVRSKPDTFLNHTEESVSRICSIQSQILHECSKYVRSGGALIYATCTVSKRENEDNVRSFLKEHGNFVLEGFSDLLPKEYEERAREGMLTLFPNLDSTDGFFMARMVRKN